MPSINISLVYHDIDWISGTYTLSATISDANELYESLHLSVRQLRPCLMRPLSSLNSHSCRVPFKKHSAVTDGRGRKGEANVDGEGERHNVFLLKGPLWYFYFHISHAKSTSWLNEKPENVGNWVNQVIIWLGLLRPWNQQTMANFGHAVAEKFSEALRRLAR